MGRQQRDYAFNSLALTAVLVASVAAALVASFAILLVQIARERERMARERRAAKMRRLRGKTDGAEVPVPLITGGLPQYFHLFLSHVWGTGRTAATAMMEPKVHRCEPHFARVCGAEDQMRIVKQRLKEMMPDLEGPPW